MSYLFTSESVSEGHPDKVSDAVSDSILDAMLTQDPNSRVACETFVTTGLTVVGGEITTKAIIDVQEVVRDTIKSIGYNKAEYMFEADSCGVLNAIHEQSPDIAQGVDEDEDKDQGAGDQGMMFGYATDETDEYMPMALAYAHRLVHELSKIRKNEPELIPYLRPDSKSQVTIEYDENDQPIRVEAIVISTQHDEFDTEENMQKKIYDDMINIVIPRVIPTDLLKDTTYHINPTGKFVIGGPHGDAGLTGRKIIVDTYGGAGAHGGGAFSGKDPSKVDRSAAYATRHIAKNLVAAGVAKQALVQVAYAIGVANPVSLHVWTYGTSKVNMSDAEISKKLTEIFDMRPKAIVERFGLKNPIFAPTSAYGHMGRTPYKSKVPAKQVKVEEKNGQEVRTVVDVEKEVEFFTWEKLDYVDKVKKAFGL